MAEWNKGKVLPQNLHNNQEFKNGDNLAIDELNAIVNNSFYASEKAEQSETTSREALDKINQFVQDEGKTAVTLNGEVQPTWSADFAEAERQKSKNLFKVANKKGYSVTKNGVTATINDDYTITLNGTNTGNNVYWNLFNGISTGSNVSADYPKLYLDNNKEYTFVIKHISGNYSGTGTSDNQVFGAVFRKTDGAAVVGGIDIGLSIKTESSKLNITRAGIDYLNNGYFRTSSGITYNNYTIGLMICDGQDTEFQSWNGAIVHEKELKEASSKKELLYNIHHDFINITESSLTTFQEYFDLFNLDKNKTYTCNIGALESSNFKNLVGKPTGFVNYVNCLIKNVVIGSGNIERNTTYQLLALDRYANGVAIGYIYKDNNAIIQFTGWTIIGETSSSGGGTNSESSTLYINEFTTLNDALSYLKNNSIDYDNVLEMEVTIGTNMSGKQNKCSISSSGTTFETTSNYRAVDSGIYSFKHSKPENGFTYYGSSVTDPNTMMFYRLTISVSSDTGHYGVKIATKQQTLSSSSLIFLQTSENLILEHVDSGDVGKVTNVKIVYIK